MLTSSSLKALKYMFNYGQFLCVFPFEWNSYSNTVSFTKSKARLRSFSIITGYMWLEAIYQFWMVCLETRDYSVPFETYLKLMVHFVSRLIVTILQTWVLFLNSTKYASLCNRMFNISKFFEEISKKKGPAAKIPLDRCSKSLWALLVVSVIHPFIVSFAYVVDYQDRKYWQSKFVPQKFYPFTVPLFALDELILSIYSDLGTIMIVCPIFLQTVLTKEWLHILRDNMESEDFCHFYRTLLLFNKNFNETYSFILGYMMISLFWITILTSTSAIRLHDKIPFPGNLMFLMGELCIIWVVIFILRPGAHLKHFSEDVKRDFGTSVQKNRIACGRSLRSLRMQICSNFILKNSTVSTFLSEAANATVLVLLMT
ncbi:unnamed protein product [Allacma fusca]|uniref:Uncharacterized protein n=1 Tax=Allacma fusca TaxID=39272 RepID=A0A8J2NT42_9HEXA|nr:unnamed protein product [Allacma fusca]